MNGVLTLRDGDQVPPKTFHPNLRAARARIRASLQDHARFVASSSRGPPVTLDQRSDSFFNVKSVSFARIEPAGQTVGRARSRSCDRAISVKQIPAPLR